MLKASALYLVIIMALVIGIICASLVAAAYFYKMEYLRKFRYDTLDDNLNSAINIVLANSDASLSAGKTFSLYGDGKDSVMVKESRWGIYEMGVAKAFEQKDTLYRIFTIANVIDSSKWVALYLADNDRPFALSGKTTIRGDAYIPKAGVQEAYVNNNAYSGDKRLIIGAKHISNKTLPSLDENYIGSLQQYIKRKADGDTTSLPHDSISRSFLMPTKIYFFKKRPVMLTDVTLCGNIALFSDTSITIDSTAELKNILIFAKSIIVKPGFRGSCQLFASDSIHVGKSCQFDYPSCIGALGFDAKGGKKEMEKISIGNGTTFKGVVFTFQKDVSPPQPMIQTGKRVHITGQVYSQGYFKLADSLNVSGSVFTNKFLYSSSITLYENYIINSKLDSKALSPYYLTPEMLPVATKRKRILQWIGSN